MANLTDHEFGGVSTDLKLSLVEGYLKAFTTALRPQFSQLWYIDAFAGTGVRTVKHKAMAANLVEDAREAHTEQRRGSAQIAIDVLPAFDRLFFVDLKKRHYLALQALKEKSDNPDRITVVRAEANAAIQELLRGERWVDKRAVMFLDPYGMHVRWDTLEAVAATRAIDVWYLVSLEGLFRQAATDRRKLTVAKRRAITRLLGPCDWEEQWYAPKPNLDHTLFDEPLDSTGNTRTADSSDIAGYVHRRLRTLFPAVLPPLVLKNKGGVPAFLLFFAISNPAPKAIGLATKIANHMLKAGSASQVRSR